MNKPSQAALRAAERIKARGNLHAIEANASIIDEELVPLREACEQAQRAICYVASITDETRLGWALQALDAALQKVKPITT